MAFAFEETRAVYGIRKVVLGVAVALFPLVIGQAAVADGNLGGTQRGSDESISGVCAQMSVSGNRSSIRNAINMRGMIGK